MRRQRVFVREYELALKPYLVLLCSSLCFAPLDRHRVERRSVARLVWVCDLCLALIRCPLRRQAAICALPGRLKVAPDSERRLLQLIHVCDALSELRLLLPALLELIVQH